MLFCTYGALAYDSGQPQISIALTPAVIMVGGRPGQSTTQTLTIMNHTGDEARFKLATEDVVVKDGKRSFSAAASRLDTALNGFGVRVLKTPVRAPKANAFCASLIGHDTARMPGFPDPNQRRSSEEDSS